MLFKRTEQTKHGLICEGGGGGGEEEGDDNGDGGDDCL
jgi:hypothetical protein